MKKIVFFAVMDFCFLAFPVSVFAGGGSEVTIVNKTGAVINQVVIKETNRDLEKFFYINIDKDSSGIVKIKKGASCNIVLFDTKGHKYGRTGFKTEKNMERIEIKKQDFISQGSWDVIKKLLFL